MRHLLLWLLACIFTSSVVTAEPTWVDPNIVRAYEKVTGRSFADEVVKLTAPASTKEPSYGNVVVRFNGGGTSNKIVIGRKNLLEILIANNRPLKAMSIGLEFKCKDGSFSWVEEYGDVPETTPHLRILRQHGRGVTAFDSVTQVDVTKLPDSVLIGGDCLRPACAGLQPSAEPRLVYTMVLDVPDNLVETKDWSCVDNIVFPPAGSWLFSDEIKGKMHSYSPDFNGEPNSASDKPDAPPVCFDLVEPCFKPQKGIAILTQFVPSEKQAALKAFDESSAGVTCGRDTTYITPIVKFDGDTCELKQAGVWLDFYSAKSGEAFATIPLEFLPRVSLVKGVTQIYLERGGNQSDWRLKMPAFFKAADSIQRNLPQHATADKAKSIVAKPAWVDPNIIKAYEKVTGKNYAEEVAKLAGAKSTPSSTPKASESGGQEKKKAAEEFNYRSVPGVVEHNDGVYLHVRLKFDGDVGILESIDPRIYVNRIGDKITRAGSVIGVQFPIELLPEISCATGVTSIRRQVRLGLD